MAGMDNIGLNVSEGFNVHSADPAAVPVKVKQDKISQAAQERIPSLDLNNVRIKEIKAELLNIGNIIITRNEQIRVSTQKIATLSKGFFKGKEIKAEKEKIIGFNKDLDFQKELVKTLLQELDGKVKENVKTLLYESHDDEVLKLASKHPQVVCDALTKAGRFDLLTKILQTRDAAVAYNAIAKHLNCDNYKQKTDEEKTVIQQKIVDFVKILGDQDHGVKFYEGLLKIDMKDQKDVANLFRMEPMSLLIRQGFDRAYLVEPLSSIVKECTQAIDETTQHNNESTKQYSKGDKTKEKANAIFDFREGVKYKDNPDREKLLDQEKTKFLALSTTIFNKTAEFVEGGRVPTIMKKLNAVFHNEIKNKFGLQAADKLVVSNFILRNVSPGIASSYDVKNETKPESKNAYLIVGILQNIGNQVSPNKNIKAQSMGLSFTSEFMNKSIDRVVNGQMDEKGERINKSWVTLLTT